MGQSIRNSNRSPALALDLTSAGGRGRESGAERDLWASVILQALTDRRKWRKRLARLQASEADAAAIDASARRQRLIEQLARQLREVESFLFDPQPIEGLGSFAGICAVLDLDPEQVRNAIRKGDQHGETEQPKR